MSVTSKLSFVHSNGNYTETHALFRLPKHLHNLPLVFAPKACCRTFDNAFLACGICSRKFLVNL